MTLLQEGELALLADALDLSRILLSQTQVCVCRLYDLNSSEDDLRSRVQRLITLSRRLTDVLRSTNACSTLLESSGHLERLIVMVDSASRSWRMSKRIGEAMK